MNLFIFDEDPYRSALWLDDVRKNKIILEAAQMLSAAMILNDPANNYSHVYKLTHHHHPVAKWVRGSRGNFKWTINYMSALAEQRGRPHKSMSLMKYFNRYAEVGKFPWEDLKPFQNSARKAPGVFDCTSISPVTVAYRKYMSMKWDADTKPPRWSDGARPSWYTPKDFNPDLVGLSARERVEAILKGV